MKAVYHLLVSSAVDESLITEWVPGAIVNWNPREPIIILAAIPDIELDDRIEATLN